MALLPQDVLWPHKEAVLESQLFRSVMAEGQNYFWKYLFSFLRKGAC